MMSSEEIYFAEQEFNRFEEIMNTKEILTKEHPSPVWVARSLKNGTCEV